MLCPVLLCAALLLLTPFEITEARALHPSADAVQVQGDGRAQMGKRSGSGRIQSGGIMEQNIVREGKLSWKEKESIMK